MITRIARVGTFTLPTIARTLLIAIVIAGLLPLVTYDARAADEDDDQIVAQRAGESELDLIVNEIVEPNLVDVPVAYASVSVRVHSCPDDFNGTGFYQFETACTSERGLYGVPIGMTSGGYSTSFLYSKPDGTGRAEPMYWGSVIPSQVTLSDISTEIVRPARVFCSLIPGEVPLASPIDGTELPVINGSISIYLAVGDQLICEWYRYPGGVVAAEDPVDPGMTGGTITLTKWNCVSPPHPSTLSGDPEYDLDTFLAACNTVMDGINFTLTGTGFVQTSTTFDGRVGFGDLDAGSYTVSEQVPEGWGEQVVFCEGNVPGRQYFRRNLFEMPVYDAAITYDLGENETLTCEWFNIYTGETGHHDDDYGQDDGHGHDHGDSNDYEDSGDYGDGSHHDDSYGGEGSFESHSGEQSEQDDTLDSDGDWLTDVEEIEYYGTDPFRNDTDDDGLFDSEEVYLYLTDPNWDDSDGDGLLDGDEVYVVWTDPLNWDTDGDGYGDGDEAYFYGSDPLDANA